jgi:hypothetical protein
MSSSLVSLAFSLILQPSFGLPLSTWFAPEPGLVNLVVPTVGTVIFLPASHDV